MRHYTIYLCISTLVVLFSVITFNWYVDPYKIWRRQNITEVQNSNSPTALNERIFKIVNLAKKPASVILLGTSRTDFGLRPTHKALGDNALNLGIADQPYLETRLLFDMLADHKNVKTVVIGLDFEHANALKPKASDFELDNFYHFRKLQLLFSISTLEDSFSFFFKTYTRSANWTERGRRIWPRKDIEAEGGHRKMMLVNEKGNFGFFYSPPPSCAYYFSSPDNKNTPLEEIRAILARAHHDHIALKLFISPSHARQWETIHDAGVWDKWEDWKRRLVIMNQEEAKRTGQKPFPLWDFSGYNSISTEPVPPLGDTTTIMHWYFDSSHYTPAVGDLILDRMFGYKSSKRTVPSDFGVLLTGKNLESNLASIRRGRALYCRTHQKDCTEIAALAQEVARSRICVRPKQ